MQPVRVPAWDDYSPSWVNLCHFPVTEVYVFSSDVRSASVPPSVLLPRTPVPRARSGCHTASSRKILPPKISDKACAGATTDSSQYAACHATLKKATMSAATVEDAPEAVASAPKSLGMRKNGTPIPPRVCDCVSFANPVAGKQWHAPKKAFRPGSGLTSYEQRAKTRVAQAAMKAKEKELKEEKEAERQVRPLSRSTAG